jgi:hypothetical protein
MRPFIGLFYQPRMIDGNDFGAISGLNEWQGKPKLSEETRLSAVLATTNTTRLEPGSYPGLGGGKPKTGCLSYGTAKYLTK